MKGLINTGFVITLLTTILIGVLANGSSVANGTMWLGIFISVIGFVFTTLFLKDKYKTEKEALYKISYYTSIVLVLLSFLIVAIFAMKVPDFTNQIQIALGLKQEVVIDTEVKIYEMENDFLVTFDTQLNSFTVKRVEDGNIRFYTLSITELNSQKQNDIRNNYHSKININDKNVIALYGQFIPCDEGESLGIPYIELNSGIFGIEGNQLIIDEVFTKIFQKENIFTNKFLTISGLVKDGTSMKSGVLEEYYADPNFNYIYNGKRLYKDLYICNDYATLNTQEKMRDYIIYLGLERDKQVSKIQGKEIKIGGDVVNKIRLYYYNNLDSLNFIEIIFTGKKDSIIIKESDAKFKFDNIQKLY